MAALRHWFGRFAVSSFLVLLAGCVPTTGGSGTPDNGGGNTGGNDGGDGGTNGDGDQTPQPSDDALPDFSLPDVNPNSARFGEQVSPRDYLANVSAWYFGAAT